MAIYDDIQKLKKNLLAQRVVQDGVELLKAWEAAAARDKAISETEEAINAVLVADEAVEELLDLPE